MQDQKRRTNQNDSLRLGAIKENDIKGRLNVLGGCIERGLRLKLKARKSQGRQDDIVPIDAQRVVLINNRNSRKFQILCYEIDHRYTLVNIGASNVNHIALEGHPKGRLGIAIEIVLDLRRIIVSNDVLINTNRSSSCSDQWAAIWRKGSTEHVAAKKMRLDHVHFSPV